MNTNLTYKEIVELATAQQIDVAFDKSSRVSYFAPLNTISERDGFNKRIVYDNIEELAESIAYMGLQEPLWLDVLPDGRLFVMRGHRRLRALRLLVAQGRMMPDQLIEFYPTRNNITEEFRVLDQYTSNNLSEKLKPLEQAKVAWSLKYDFGDIRSNEDVAKLMCVSRQTVDNLIMIHSAPDDMRELVHAGAMSLTEALSIIRSQNKANKQADESELLAAQAKINVPDMLKDSLAKEVRELKELEQSDTAKVEKEVVYDMDRAEIVLVQNCIKNFDKLESIVSKLDAPEQTKDDVARIVGWIQNDLSEVREWIHKNKKQNKLR